MKMNIEKVIMELESFQGREIKIMEVCGTHTASISRNGIKNLISPQISLISGPGCPVCVTPSAFIDKCLYYAKKDGHVVLSFGDMIKVPGSKGNLAQAKADGAHIEVIYSPLEAVQEAVRQPGSIFVVAAVGFETTAPAFALALEEAVENKLKNIKFLTAIKRIMPALSWLCENESAIDGFISPGHVSVIIGSEIYKPLSHRYKKPFVIAGFEPEHILSAVYDLVQQIRSEQYCVHNLYTNAVRPGGNEKALNLINRYFTYDSAFWRGLGSIAASGLYIKDEYIDLDGGSRGLDNNVNMSLFCCCDQVILGRLHPRECSLFGEICHPSEPFGPCMVSAEGPCSIYYNNWRYV